MSKLDKHICSKCKEHRVIVADLVIHANVMSTSISTKTHRDTAHTALTMRYALCRGCHRKLVGVDNDPVINLSSGGVRKRLTPRQEALALRARNRAERKSLQGELEWLDRGDDE